ncbi:hypothetical protein [Desulfosporosinus sp. FKB]|uniref:hypothetical protein n=1 Tax=Desulfosporosinus sp. FKB TaxID=1969835 RepID=UPI000B4A273B|nr:hypothetical protein [Desulfosporosinus sp. FKB]
MSTEITRHYENKIFNKDQFKKFALKLCRFLNISPSDGYVYLRQKDQDFEISSKVTADELENICEFGTSVSRLDFHYMYNVISFRPCSNSLNVLYVINGNMKYSEKLIFFVENVLEITRLTEELSELSDGYGRNEANNKRQYLEIDKPVFDLMKQVYERETENTLRWTLEKFLHQMLKAHCQEIMGYNQ